MGDIRLMMVVIKPVDPINMFMYQCLLEDPALIFIYVLCRSPCIYQICVLGIKKKVRAGLLIKTGVSDI